MNREEQRMELWCDEYLEKSSSPLDMISPRVYADDALQMFDETFPETRTAETATAEVKQSNVDWRAITLEDLQDAVNNLEDYKNFRNIHSEKRCDIAKFLWEHLTAVPF